MIRMTLAAALVAVASLASVGAASAFPQINPVYAPKLNPLGGKMVQTETTSPGDAFHPQTAAVDVRGECLASGGTPKRTFDGTDFVWTCRQ